MVAATRKKTLRLTWSPTELTYCPALLSLVSCIQYLRVTGVSGVNIAAPERRIFVVHSILKWRPIKEPNPGALCFEGI